MDFTVDEELIFQKKKVCAFTGHRPQKLALLNVSQTVLYEKIKEGLKSKITEAIRDGYDVFLTGMALGVDLWAAQAVLEIKETLDNPPLLYAVLPFEGQEDIWNKADIALYHEILDKCDEVLVVDEMPSRNAFLKRDEFIVDKCERLIAVYNESLRGGTWYTVAYAENREKEIAKISI